MQHISHTDSGLGAYVDLFRRHVSCCHPLAVDWMDALWVRDVAEFAEHHTHFITRRCHASILPNTGQQNSRTKQPIQKEMSICISFFTVLLLFKVLFCSLKRGLNLKICMLCFVIIKGVRLNLKICMLCFVKTTGVGLNLKICMLCFVIIKGVGHNLKICMLCFVLIKGVGHNLKICMLCFVLIKGVGHNLKICMLCFVLIKGRSF